MYPSLVNCTTIDLFADWPQDALLEVGERYLSQIDLAGDDKVTHLAKKTFFFLHHLIFRTNFASVWYGKIIYSLLFLQLSIGQSIVSLSLLFIRMILFLSMDIVHWMHSLICLFSPID